MGQHKSLCLRRSLVLFYIFATVSSSRGGVLGPDYVVENDKLLFTRHQLSLRAVKLRRNPENGKSSRDRKLKNQ